MFKLFRAAFKVYQIYNHLKQPCHTSEKNHLAINKTDSKSSQNPRPEPKKDVDAEPDWCTLRWNYPLDETLDDFERRSALYLGSWIWWSTGTGANGGHGACDCCFRRFFCWWFLRSCCWIELTVVVGQEKNRFMYKYCIYIHIVPDKFGVVIFPSSFGWHWKLCDEVWRCN